MEENKKRDEADEAKEADNLTDKADKAPDEAHEESPFKDEPAPLAPVTAEPPGSGAERDGRDGHRQDQPVNWKRRFKLIGLALVAIVFLVFLGFNRERIRINFLFGEAELQGGIMFLLIFLVGFLLGRGYSIVVRTRRH